MKGVSKMTRIPEIDFKEQTACGGRVRYTIDPETDFIVYSCFTACKAGLICRKCAGWQNICPEFKELAEMFREYCG